ncbi:MAG TPA: IclR family transcriptional regulator [Nocardioidaceae bacterium]|nr:IclR family transcriptional regulator [Nocardioidaceae bacterium]
MAASGTQAIDRAAELLSMVILADEPRAFSDLVADTGLAKSTASRLLQALERHRLVNKADEGYEAGPLFAIYASRHEPEREITWLARPILEAVSRDTGETVNLAIVRNSAVVQIAQIDSTFLVGTTNWVDVDVPPHCSALGKVFFAAGAIAVPRTEMDRLTDRTVTDPAELERELEQVRRQGYATALSELEIGLAAIAAPVHDRSGAVIAAIGISGPSDRINKELRRLGKLLQAHARDLSVVLGHEFHDQTRKEGAA